MYEYIYEICMPPGWEDFFAKKNVKGIIRGISAILLGIANSPDEVEIYPKLPYVMYALFLTRPEDIRVIILGQDPYHGRGQAHGLSFSVPKGVPIPSSAKNIFKELIAEGLIDKIPEHGSLVRWAKQGVLMINSAFTVLQDTPNIHATMWKEFTSELLQFINALPQPKVALLWGNFAQQLGSKYLTCEIIQTSHPSGLSAMRATKTAPAFIGSGCFARTASVGQIKW